MQNNFWLRNERVAGEDIAIAPFALAIASAAALAAVAALAAAAPA